MTGLLSNLLNVRVVILSQEFRDFQKWNHSLCTVVVIKCRYIPQSLWKCIPLDEMLKFAAFGGHTQMETMIQMFWIHEGNVASGFIKLCQISHESTNDERPFCRFRAKWRSADKQEENEFLAFSEGPENGTPQGEAFGQLPQTHPLQHQGTAGRQGKSVVTRHLRWLGSLGEPQKR
jgi:hypothetical protein